MYASPVYASHSWTAAQRATGIRQSSALAVPAAAAASIERQLKAAAEAMTAAAKAGGATGPRVVVLDTGLAASPYDHPVMGPCVACPSGADDVPDRHPDPAGDDRLDPAAGHGTFIAGLVLQVEPRAQVSVHRVLSGLGDGDEAAIAQAIEALAGQVDVLNLSFSGYTLEHPALLAAAVRRVQAAGALVVASAGNDATCRPTFPASLPDVVSVGAVGPGGPAPFSNYGPVGASLRPRRRSDQRLLPRVRRLDGGPERRRRPGPASPATPAGAARRSRRRWWPVPWLGRSATAGARSRPSSD